MWHQLTLASFSNMNKSQVIWIHNTPIFFNMFERLCYECTVNITHLQNFTLLHCVNSIVLCFLKRKLSASPRVDFSACECVYVYIYTYVYMHTACLYIWHFYILCWVIVLDWTVKYCVWGWVVIFITVLVFYCHYLLLLIYRMSCMHL